ncbi:MAG: EVE domain-containing protein [Verrucomicrobiae bacterium]|nr:EVE domain-containing protein [Verrucomicrobiae bacterium]
MPNYWLVKTEPQEYSLADLERDGATQWTGVHNPLAKKHLAAMKPGDLVLVYHTGNERQIVGLAEVSAAGAEPQLRFRQRFAKPVPLAAIKAQPQLRDWALVRQGRLSVMPVTLTQWKLVQKMMSES